jgi:hypothetical protein
VPRDLFHRVKRGDGAGEIFTMFSGQDSSPVNLPTSLTVGGSDVDPVFAYDARDATLTTWPAKVGQPLTYVQTGGVAASVGLPAPFTDPNAPAVVPGDLFDGYWEGPDASYGNPGSDDWVIEAVLRWEYSATGRVPIGTTQLSGKGWSLFEGSSTLLRSYINNGSASSVGNATSSMVEGCWYHLIVAFDRSNRIKPFRNGLFQFSSTLLTGVAGDLAAGTFRIGGRNSSSMPIAWLAMWKGSGLYTTEAEYGEIARERMLHLAGAHPTKFAGSAVPLVLDRESVAYLDINLGGESSLFCVGQRWPRLVSRSDGSNTGKGYLAETESLNSAEDSDDINGSDWTLVNVTRGAQVNTPIENVQAYGIDTASAGEDPTFDHYAEFSRNPFTPQQHCMSAFIAPGAKSWVRLESQNIIIADVYCHFNLSGQGSIGTSVNVFRSGIQYVATVDGRPWYRCWIAYSGPSALHTHRIYPADGDDDVTYTGTDSTDIYVVGVMHEYDRSAPSSLIRTSGASATRLADELKLSAGDNIGGSSPVELALYAELSGQDLGNGGSLITVSDGASAADRIELGFTSSDGFGDLASAATGGNAGSVTGTATDLEDGTWRQAQGALKSNSAKLAVDGSEVGTEDTSVDVPSDLDELAIGMDEASGNQPDGVISSVRVFKKAVTKTPSPSWS